MLATSFFCIKIAKYQEILYNIYKKGKRSKTLIYNVIPDKFFSPLASPNKKVYADCIFLIYKLMNSQLAFGIERDLIIDCLMDYFNEHQEELVDEDDIKNIKSSRDKAGLILRKLYEYGWVDQDQTKNYEQIISLQDYAIEIIKTLDNLVNNKKLEYEGYISTIYTLIRSVNINKGIVITQVYENTDKLIVGLKSLNANIKKYINELTKHKTVKEIMSALLDDYRSNIVDKAYHRLITSDNVSRYRPKIIEYLKDFLNNSDYINEAAEDIGNREEIELQAAIEKTRDYIQNVINIFNDIDLIIEDINKKNSQYQKSALNRAKFLLSNTEDLTGQIKSILQYVTDEVIQEDTNLKAIYEIEIIDELFKVFNQGFVDNESLKAPFEGKRDFKADSIEIIEIDIKAREEKMKKIKEKMNSSMNAKNIEKEVLKLLGEKDVIVASKLDLKEKTDFIKLIYIRLYGNRDSSKYKIKPLERQVIVHGAKFNDFEIWRK